MEDSGTQVAAPVVIHQSPAQRFFSAHHMAKKRSLPFQPDNYVHHNTSGNWNPKSWGWDSMKFVAKSVQCDEAQVGSDAHISSNLLRSVSNHTEPGNRGKYDENLQLKLGDGDGNGAGRSGRPGMNLREQMQPVARPNKRVRSGSPACANHPTCQVDDCKEDLSNAKDYHRRHKVCEVHSKATKAIVGKQMQRFCQQCSRFHPLSEFDEGKRSCRRRLAGHNRRRRKTQPEDAAPRVFIPSSPQKSAKCDVDIINLLALIARAQGNTNERSGMFPSLPEKDQLIQILSKINSLPLPENLTTKIPLLQTLNGGTPNVSHAENQKQMSTNASSPSTIDLLAVLSAAAGAPSSDLMEIQSQPSTEGSDSEKSRSPYVNQATNLNVQRGSIVEFPSVGGDGSSTSYHSPMTEVDCHVQESSPSLHLQLFSSSPEDNSARVLAMAQTYLSSNSSNPSGERSPVSSPPLVHDLFPMHSSKEIMKDDRISNSEDVLACLKSTLGNGCDKSLQLFGSSIRTAENSSIQNFPYQAGYASSSGSDHSPSSLNSDNQDRTGRIIFKLFNKDPSHLPGSIRAEIFNWLSNSPSEMESYIRPGCIILSVYLSMPSFVWDQLALNLLNYVNSLVKEVNVDFWGSGRFLVYTEGKMASHNDGRIRLCKSWRTQSTPELISVSPVAVVAGQETSLVLRGRNLTVPGTKVHCTHTDGCNIKEVRASSCQDSEYDEISMGNFKVMVTASNMLGRCFVEVENNFRGTSFPVIIADDAICQELRRLEPKICSTSDVSNYVPTSNTQMSRSKEDALHFLDELGWLFQRKRSASLLEIPEYKLVRFKFLLVFSVEHDFCALVKTLLDILLELNLGKNELAEESLALLSDIHLLNRAVKQRCRNMIDLLIHYSIIDPVDSSEKFVFLPNFAGPGGVTPLHLAACTSSSDDIIDALTNDPHEVGLQSWSCVLDANGLSPHAYSLMRNNHSYNTLVAQKLADRKNAHVSISIEDEFKTFQIEATKENTTLDANGANKHCSRCAVAAAHGYSKTISGSQGLLQRPYIHTMLVVAAVCVCVCVFLRGHPYVGCVAPFAWENLNYGPM